MKFIVLQSLSCKLNFIPAAHTYAQHQHQNPAMVSSYLNLPQHYYQPMNAAVARFKLR